MVCSKRLTPVLSLWLLNLQKSEVYTVTVGYQVMKQTNAMLIWWIEEGEYLLRAQMLPVGCERLLEYGFLEEGEFRGNWKKKTNDVLLSWAPLQGLRGWVEVRGWREGTAGAVWGSRGSVFPTLYTTSRQYSPWLENRRDTAAQRSGWPQLCGENEASDVQTFSCQHEKKLAANILLPRPLSKSWGIHSWVTISPHDLQRASQLFSDVLSTTRLPGPVGIQEKKNALLAVGQNRLLETWLWRICRPLVGGKERLYGRGPKQQKDTKEAT